jgi:SAM-dependent methyltransferase
MRRYWDERARENAVFYVDTSISYDDPDLDRFLAVGHEVVRIALLDAPVQPPERNVAVELGSGLGRNCAALADHFERVIGVDISKEMIERANGLVASPKITFELGNGEDLQPVTTASADFVLSFTVFQHMPSYDLVASNIADVARVLRPGGIAALQWNNLPHGAWWQAKAAVRRAGARLGVRRWRDARYAAPFIGRRVAWPRIERELREHGLEPRATDGLGTLFAWVWAERR